MKRPAQGLTGFVANHVSRFTDWRNTRNERRSLATLATISPTAALNGSRSDRRSARAAIRTLAKRRPDAIRNWYEAGFPFLDGTRSGVPSIIQDARYDQNLVTRREMLRRMRYWSQNSGIYKSTLDVRRQYVIGTHAPVITSLSKNTAFAEIAETVFEEMIKTAGLDGEPLYQLLAVAFDAKKRDGDVLSIDTSIKAKIPIRQGTKYAAVIEKSVPRIQLVEGHRLETPPNRWNEEGLTIVDGVQFKQVEQTLPNGAKRTAMVRIGYWVKDAFNGFTDDEAYSFIPVEHSQLIFSATRINQIRGLSDFYAGEVTLALLEDLLKLEMRAQEVQSNLSVFITNGAGQIVDQKTQAYVGAIGIKLAKDDAGKPVVTTNDIEKAKEVYSKVWGGNQFVGRTGDTVEFLAPNRPSEATQALFEYLINLWCAASESSRTLVFPKSSKGQGTEVRGEFDKFNTSCIGEFNLNWKPLIHRVWKYFIGWALQNDERLAKFKESVDDWERIEVSPPRSVLVDAGYDSAAQLADLAAGVTNLHFVAQRLGTTAKRLIKLAVQDIYELKKACLIASGQPTDNIEVKPEEVRQSLADVVKNLAAMKTAEAAKTAATNPKEEPANA